MGTSSAASANGIGGCSRGSSRRRGPRHDLVRVSLLEVDARLLGCRESPLDRFRDHLRRRVHEVLQPHRRRHVAVVVALAQRPHAHHVLGLGQESLHFGPEAFIGTRLRDDAQHGHEVGEPFVQLCLGVLDAPSVLGNAHPRDVDVLADVRLAGLRLHEFLQLVDDLLILLQLQPPGVEYPQRDALLRVVASLLRDRLALPRLGEPPLKDLVYQRALADARCARR